MSNVKIYGANCQKKEHPLNYQFSYPVMLRYFSILSFIIFLYKSEDSYLDSDVPFCLFILYLSRYSIHRVQGKCIK